MSGHTQPDQRALPPLTVASYGDAVAILTSAAFVQAGFDAPSAKAVFEGSLVTLNGRDHVERRRLENPLFEPLALRRFEVLVVEKINTVLASFLADQGATGYVELDIEPFVRDVVLDAAAALIGIDVAGNPAALASLKRYGQRFDDANAEARFKIGAIGEEFWEIRRLIDEFDAEFVAPAWERRRALLQSPPGGGAIRGDGDVHTLDLITLLALHAEHWDRDRILHEIVLYVVGSTSTSVSGVTASVVELLNWFEAHGEDRARVADAGFIRAAVHEALRLNPVIPTLTRRAATNTVLPSGEHVAEGRQVTIDLHAVNRDPVAFAPNPDQFDPHRSIGDKARPFALAFGAGPHMCIGQRFATGRSREALELGEPAGVVVQLTNALLQAGVELHPDRPAQLKEGTTLKRFASVPTRIPTEKLEAYLRSSRDARRM